VPVGADFLRMEAEHRIAKAWIAATGIEHRLTRIQVDGRDEYLRNPCLSGTSHNSIAIRGKLLTIKMAMGIYEFVIINCQLSIIN
jgi:hypothetical protein